MTKRLPKPKNGKRQRLELDDDELMKAEVAATGCRLSLASFFRATIVAVVEDWPELMEKVKAAAARIEAEAPADRRRPGRPKGAEPKPPKKGRT
jgi:hypothetical protein